MMGYNYNESHIGSSTSSNNADISNTATVMNLYKEVGKKIGNLFVDEISKLEDTRKDLESTWIL